MCPGKFTHVGDNELRINALLGGCLPSVFDRIRIEVDHINALVKAGKLDEAAALTRALAAKLPDAPSRQQLDDQAKQLESDAASNREITAFNEAVELFNKGDYKSAKKIIDELLKSARSEQVLTDATKLKATLDKLLKK